MATKKLEILDQNQDFEALLSEAYRRAAGVSDSFARDLMKLNRASPTPAKKKATASTRSVDLAQKLIGKKAAR